MHNSTRLMLLAACLALMLQQSIALVDLGRLYPYGKEWMPPVTRWLLSDDPTVIPHEQILAWRKIGSKLWTFMSTLDHDFVDATGKTVPPGLATQRVFGPSVKCGRFTRQMIRIPFHDCGTFDVGNTGSFGDTGKPRFGCNGSLRWELAPCNTGPQCVNGIEAAVNLATGAFLPEHAFASVVAKYGANNVVFGQDQVNQRRENTGFANLLAFYYQIKFETQIDEPLATRLAEVSLADIGVYAGMLAVAKCGGPQIEFHPGRTDSATFDGDARLPAPTEPLHHTVSYFWTNGMTDFDMVNLLAAHTTACFNVGCLDATPSSYDVNWVQQIQTVTTATDPRICKFQRADLNLPPPPPVQLCFLPSDAEFNARADIRQYLAALVEQTTIAAAAAQHNPCFYQPGIPEVHGACDVGVGVGYDFTPFTLARTEGGSVNLCMRKNHKLIDDRSGCPHPRDIIPNFHKAVATSYFKMSKLYADATGAVAGAPWGVARQPCTPGLIQIGVNRAIEDGIARPNPACLCCPKPLPQDFNIGLEDVPIALRFPLND